MNLICILCQDHGKGFYADHIQPNNTWRKNRQPTSHQASQIIDGVDHPFWIVLRGFIVRIDDQKSESRGWKLRRFWRKAKRKNQFRPHS